MISTTTAIIITAITTTIISTTTSMISTTTAASLGPSSRRSLQIVIHYTRGLGPQLTQHYYDYYYDYCCSLSRYPDRPAYRSKVHAYHP